MARLKKQLVLLTILIMIILSGCNTDQRQSIESGKDITMFITTDIHYLAKTLTDNGAAYQTYLSSSDGRQLEYSDEIVSAFSDEVISQNPDILIISGDLTNNGEEESHQKLAEKLKRIEDTSDTRIYVIPGNHDINNPWARGFEGNDQYVATNISAKEFRSIYKDFGFNEAISKDKSSLSYLAAPSEDLWLLMLDTCEYDRNDEIGYPMTNGQLTEATLEWVRKCSKLAEEKNAELVAVMHHNLFNHNYVMHYGYTLDNGEEVYKVLQECGIKLALSGHMHIQNIKSRTEKEQTTYDIITSSLIMYPEQYGVLKYNPSEGFEYDTSEVDVEAWAHINGIEDPNLTGFEEYSKKRFTDVSYQKAYKLLNKAGGYTEQEKEEMANTFTMINRNYFAGTTEEIRDEVLISDGYKLWKDADETLFLRDYVLSVFPNIVMENNQLSIPKE